MVVTYIYTKEETFIINANLIFNGIRVKKKYYIV